MLDFESGSLKREWIFIAKNGFKSFRVLFIISLFRERTSVKMFDREMRGLSFF